MKHFLKIIIISFIFSTTSLAQEAVYYCIDDETIGFEYTNKQKNNHILQKNLKRIDLNYKLILRIKK